MSDLKGTELRKFDQVNRMSIPPKFRGELGETVVIMKSIHKEPCLMLFSEKAWDAFRKKAIEKYEGAMQAKAERKLAGRSDVLSVDKSGRISIKDSFKAYAGLDDEVFAVGIADRVELWNPAKWDEWYGTDDNDDDDDDDFFARVGYSDHRGDGNE